MRTRLCARHSGVYSAAAGKAKWKSGMNSGLKMNHMEIANRSGVTLADLDWRFAVKRQRTSLCGSE
jgi:hypothetical protein